MVPFSCLRPSASQQSSFTSCLSHSPTSFCASTTTYALAPTPFCHPDASCVQVSSMICRSGLPGLEVCFSFLPSPVFVSYCCPSANERPKRRKPALSPGSALFFFSFPLLFIRGFSRHTVRPSPHPSLQTQTSIRKKIRGRT